MEYNMKWFLSQLMNMLGDVDYIKSDDVPNIDLYMDQVTTFMDEQLYGCKRYEDDKILTKTMINNYAKNNLLPSPEKKKYSKEHMLVLLFIYYFKNILSISDIQSILNPITDRFFGNTDGFNMRDVYEQIFDMENGEAQKFIRDMAKKYKIALDSFKDFPEEDQSLLQTFAFICELSFDVYLKKMLIEKIIDGLNSDREKENARKAAEAGENAAKEKSSAKKDKAAAKKKTSAPKDDSDETSGSTVKENVFESAGKVVAEKAASVEKNVAKKAASVEKAVADKVVETGTKMAENASKKTQES